MRRKRCVKAGFFVVVILAILGIFFSNAAAEMTSSFHGYFESNFILRDADGLQHGFFDEAYGVQQRNTLKFDIDIDPDMRWGSFKVEKVHLTYRGAYDSIFDLAAHRYNIKENIGASRFDYGLKDIRFENDLREAFIDFAYNGDLGMAFFRPGRQIVSWGEGMLETLNDVINPPDNSYAMFFQSPDDVKTPLWMGRLNYNIPRISSLPGLNLNFDFLWIPDIRPSQLGPRDSVAGNLKAGLEAPYINCISLVDLRGLNVREDVPTNENEYGVKVSSEIGDNLSLSLLYFRDVVNDPAVQLKNWAMTPGGPAPSLASFTHNKQHVYGGYFSYQLVAFGTSAVVRGEISHHTASPIALAAANTIMQGPAARLPPSQWVGLTYLLKPVTKTTLSFDKDVRIRWLSNGVTKMSFEWLHKVINEWDDRLDNTYFKSRSTKIRADRKNIREQDVFMVQVMTWWWAAKVGPTFVAAYNPGKHGEGGTGMIAPSIKWYITPSLYSDLKLQAFFGDTKSSYSFGSLVNTSEATFKLGYEW